MKDLSMLVVAGMLGGAAPIIAQPAADLHTRSVCTRSDAAKADAELDGITSWQSLHRAYTNSKQCDDGALAEGYSEIVAKLMVRHWDRIIEAVEISRTDPAFESWFVRHLDETDSNSDLVEIERLVRTACPKTAVSLCKKIRAQLVSLRCEPGFPKGVACVAAHHKGQ